LLGVRQRLVISSARNIRTERKTDSAHDDGPTINSSPDPLRHQQYTRASLFKISNSLAIPVGLWLTCGIGKR
jgi:hypothetical protein